MYYDKLPCRRDKSGIILENSRAPKELNYTHKKRNIDSLIHEIGTRAFVMKAKALYLKLINANYG